MFQKVMTDERLPRLTDGLDNSNACPADGGDEGSFVGQQGIVRSAERVAKIRQ